MPGCSYSVVTLLTTQSAMRRAPGTGLSPRLAGESSQLSGIKVGNMVDNPSSLDLDQEDILV